MRKQGSPRGIILLVISFSVINYVVSMSSPRGMRRRLIFFVLSARSPRHRQQKTWRPKCCPSVFYENFRRDFSSERFMIMLTIKQLAATSCRNQPVRFFPEGPPCLLLRNRGPAFGKTCPDPCPCADGRPAKSQGQREARCSKMVAKALSIVLHRIGHRTLLACRTHILERRVKHENDL